MLKTYLNDESIRDFKNIIKNEIEAILLYIKQNAIKINAETIEAEMIDVKDKPFYEIVLDGRIKELSEAYKNGRLDEELRRYSVEDAYHGKVYLEK